MYVCMFFTKNLVLDLHRREIIGRVNLYAIIVRSVGRYWISRSKQNLYIAPRYAVPQIRPCEHKYDIKLLFLVGQGLSIGFQSWIVSIAPYDALSDIPSINLSNIPGDIQSNVPHHIPSFTGAPFTCF